jgi:hypothetical protein
MSVMKPSKVDMNNIIFREAKKVVDKENKKIGLRVPIYYNHNNETQKFLIQTPKMKVPFGLSSFEGQNFMIGPQFSGFRENFQDQKDTQQMYFFMEKLTDHIVTQIKKNIVEWFGKGYAKFENDQIKTALMWPIIKMSDENKYDPTMKIKLPAYVDKNSGKVIFTTKVFNKDRELLEINSEFPLETIPKFSDVRLIMHVSDIFVGSSKASLTIRAEQIMVYPPETYLHDCAFLEEDNEETAPEIASVRSELVNTFDESEEDESEEEQSETQVEQVAPEPEKKRTRVLKKPE